MIKIIKNIGYFILSLILLFLVLSPVKIIYTGISSGNNFYYFILFLIIFFLPYLVDFVLNKEDEVFSFKNFKRGLGGLAVSLILTFIYYSTYDSLCMGALLSFFSVITIQIVVIYNDYYERWGA